MVASNKKIKVLDSWDASCFNFSTKIKHQQEQTPWKLALESISKLTMGSHEKYFLKSNEEMKLKDVVELYLKVNNMQVKLKWGEKPHSSRDFFQSLNILDVLAGWEPQVLLADGLKNL